MVDKTPITTFEYRIRCDKCNVLGAWTTKNENWLGGQAMCRGWQIRYETIPYGGGAQRMIEAICQKCKDS